MVFGSTPDLHVFTDRLRRLHGLSDDDRAAIERLPLQTASIPVGDSIVRVGEQADRCAVIMEGMAASYKISGDGQRQIMCLHLAGDLPDLQSLCFGTTETGIAAMSACRVGYLPSRDLLKLCSLRPSLVSILWRETLLQAAIVREALLNVGRRDARTRLAHLLCEVIVRQHDVGMASNWSCHFPLTQVALADVVGLSTVHVNRMVQELRTAGLIALEGRQLTAMDWERLRVVGDFDPAYLRADRRSLAP